MCTSLVLRYQVDGRWCALCGTIAFVYEQIFAQFFKFLNLHFQKNAFPVYRSRRTVGSIRNFESHKPISFCVSSVDVDLGNVSRN